MTIGKTIYTMRTEAKLTQEQFAEVFGVSQQSVQKWENDAATPDLEKLIRISKHFSISLDALILGNGKRAVEEMQRARQIKPSPEYLAFWERYSLNLFTEYHQSVEEGLDVEAYRDLFFGVSSLPDGEVKEKIADALFDLVINAKKREGYPYNEPSELDEIRELRKREPLTDAVDKDGLYDKIHGAWVGRMCGCLLGMPLEGVRTEELVSFLRETDNFPMHRYLRSADLTEEITGKYRYNFSGRPRQIAENITAMPADDDTNYVMLAQQLISDYGRDFTPMDVAAVWTKYESKDCYCTAERVAYCNFIKGYVPPQSAVYKNPYREWIGAQIRGDYFGYINPGDPETAAEMAWRDASISHIKNGIYGEMFVSAMLAAAAVTDDMEKIIRVGLGEIPHTSRLYEDIMTVIGAYKEKKTFRDCLGMIYEKYNEHMDQHAVHTIPNAMIVAAALLYGGGDFGKSVCMAVEAGFDTDCNGATVGSVVGMAKGIGGIPEVWKSNLNDTLYTSLFGIEKVKISERARLTLSHIR